MLQHKKIILGISGGIAAYKCPHLVRLLVKEGAEVRVVMSAFAGQFVTANTLSVVSKNKVWTDFFDADHSWNNHVHLAEWADILLIAPLTANTLAKMASGICDNILLATYLSARSKTMVAPAMDLDMYQHPSVKKNIEIIKSYGNLVIPAETGELASGLSGEGRMAEPENIASFLNSFFSKNLPLAGKKVLVNAGPTHEPIDPVRYIGNKSSGKMGIALCEALVSQGANVTLVMGPGNVVTANKPWKTIHVESSDEMFEATVSNFANVDIAICSAAVADYKPVSKSPVKLKKKDGDLKLEFVKTSDILMELGKRKTKQVLVGFALETDNLVDYAKEKLKNKNLDIIIANSASDPKAGIGADSNQITIIDKHNKITNFELKSKQAVAKDIVNYLVDFMK
jgi:phosphopantothenoylcysteine decarboxylase/phosphopantothenate--cysteine ligase